MSLYLLCLILFSIGIYCLLVKKNLIKKIIGLGITEYAINLFFILLGYRNNGEAPILDKQVSISNFVDPLPQALILTSIVIGLGVTSLMVALVVRIYEKYKTFNINEISKLKGYIYASCFCDYSFGLRVLDTDFSQDTPEPCSGLGKCRGIFAFVIFSAVYILAG
ncbi:MAG: sodium:proton antiporter [Candidatus Omnitrophota bacterium]